METIAKKIRKAIKENGGLESFSASVRRNKPVGCPSKNMMRTELQELSKEELHVAFVLNLIGNNSQHGTIVGNARLDHNFTNDSRLLKQTNN